MELGTKNSDDEALRVLRQEGSPLIMAATENIHKILELKVETCNQLKEKLEQLQIIALVIGITSIALAVCISVILIRYFTKAISDPIENICEISEEIARGNLNLIVKVDSGDEIGKLGTSLNDILDYFKFSNC